MAERHISRTAAAVSHVPILGSCGKMLRETGNRVAANTSKNISICTCIHSTMIMKAY